MRAITLHTFSPLDAAHFSHVTPLSTVLTLRNTQVHIGSVDHGNITSNIEMSVDNFLGIGSVLHVLDIDPYDSYVWLGQNLDDSRFRCENNIVEDVDLFEDFFNVFRRNTSVGLVIKVRNFYDFKVGFWLWESRRVNFVLIVLEQILYNLFNFL